MSLRRETTTELSFHEATSRLVVIERFLQLGRRDDTSNPVDTCRSDTCKLVEKSAPDTDITDLRKNEKTFKT